MFSLCSLSESPSPTEPADLTGPSAGCACCEVRIERQLRMLQELAEIGMGLARNVGRQAEAQAAKQSVDEEPAADLGLVFSRIARAVRQTLALEARLDHDHHAQLRQDETDRTARRAEARAHERRTAVRDAVEQAIEADAHESDFEELFDELSERLRDRDDADFMDRPMRQVVARICRDLGVAFDPGLWPDEDWAMAQTAARKPEGLPPPIVQATKPPSPHPYWDG